MVSKFMNNESGALEPIYHDIFDTAQPLPHGVSLRTKNCSSRGEVIPKRRRACIRENAARRREPEVPRGVGAAPTNPGGTCTCSRPAILIALNREEKGRKFPQIEDKQDRGWGEQHRPF